MADTHRHPVNGRPATGLYQPEYEHDACGVAFVADLTGRRSHDIVQRALTALIRLEHRGARGAEVETGDGAGLLLQVPDGFYREVVPFELPEAGGYAVGNAFLPTDEVERSAAITEIERIADEEGLRVLGWRELPIDPDGATLGPTSRRVMPVLRQLFVAAQDPGVTGIALDRLAFCLRKRAEHGTRAYFPSLSARTIVYKGMLTEQQLVKFYPDVTDERVTSSLGHGALPVLHQHLPVLAAGPPVPDDLPQRRDQHPARQPELDEGAGGAAAHRALQPASPVERRAGPGRPRAAVPDRHPRSLGLGDLRRGARAAAPRRAVAAARGADDDPGGLGEPRRDGPGPPGVLRVPLRPDGAVGRPRTDRVHRRHGDRRGAGPQRASSRAVLGHRGRPGRAGQRGRRARRRTVGRGAQGAARAGPDVPGGHRRRPDRRRRRDQGGTGGRAPLRGLAARRHGAAGRTARPRA